jgi:glutamate 5-kinase
MKGTRHLTIVIKIGSSSIVDETTHQPILSILSLIVETATKLRKDGHRVVIVSSGAIAVGLQRMNIPKKPKHLPQIQVCHVLVLRSPFTAILWAFVVALFFTSVCSCMRPR